MISLSAILLHVSASPIRRTLSVLPIVMLAAAPVMTQAQWGPRQAMSGAPMPMSPATAASAPPSAATMTSIASTTSALQRSVYSPSAPSPRLAEGAAAASVAASAAAAAISAGQMPYAGADMRASGTPDTSTDLASGAEASDDLDDPPAAAPFVHGKPLPLMPEGMNEAVIRIPLTGAQANLSLEATLFKPDGPGPFPVVIFNHGKERGDPKQQKRSRPLALAREFVQRGYAVLAPNREGFANSDGSYSEQLCGIEELGLEQAADVAAAVHYIKQQPYAQSNRIVIIGASEGGLASIAYGEQPATGVAGIINFSGGLRQDACDSWQQAMIDAFHAYGERSQIPTLWFYGDNDRFWPSALAQQLYSAYRSGGGHAMLIDFGSYKDNAHRLVGDRDSVPVWWPGIARFLHRLGMPIKVRFAVPEPAWPPATGFAPIQAVNAVPYLDAEGRAGYQNFLEKYPTRAFALSDSGAWSWAEGGDDPVSVALDSCQRNSRDACHLYAINDTVVWPTR